MESILAKYFREVYSVYIPHISQLVPTFPFPYLFPDGNPIVPILPVQIKRNGIMIIGAFPSARFERRGKVLIPVANNLSPFAEEKYFDGREIRNQASRESLEKCYFPILNLDPNELWITDLVKIYLYPEKHINNCAKLFPEKTFVNTHKMFPEIAKASMIYMKEEIMLANPKLIITFGEVVARTLTSDMKTSTKDLLNGEIRRVNFDKEYCISHLAHPEIRRINRTWDELTDKAIDRLAYYLKTLHKGHK